jgi:predicted nucleic acid-binding protein
VVGSVKNICRDPNDDMVLECAVRAGAKAIVTGDKDLLTLGEYEGIRIVTPRTFLDEFQG